MFNYDCFLNNCGMRQNETSSLNHCSDCTCPHRKSNPYSTEFYEVNCKGEVTYYTSQPDISYSDSAGEIE